MANDTQIICTRPYYAQDFLIRRFLNGPESIALDTLLGTVNTNANVGLLNYGKVIVCRDYAEKDIVKIVSGGSSGHEPAHSGFVGKGMLTAAIQGDIFQSPYIPEIVNAIKEISYKLTAGVLVIIQNNTSDRLKFGLAVERARNQGIDVNLILVTDEFCVINERQGRRGLAGVVLINKIAGALAERDFSLDDITKYCTLVNKNVSTILFSLKPLSPLTAQECICTKKMKETEMEIGTELHGGEGLLRIEKSDVKNCCAFMLDRLINHFELKKFETVIIMINNLGNALRVEELTVAKEVVNFFHNLNVNVARLYCGKFLTALDMEGMCITLLRVFDNAIIEYLDDHCEAIAWGGFANCKTISLNLQDPIVCRVSKRKRAIIGGPRLTNERANIIFYAIQFACDALISCERQLNTMDAEGGDGNVGTKIKRGAQIVLLRMQQKSIDFAFPRLIFETLSEISEKNVSGGIGAFYSIFFEAASNYFRHLSETSVVNLTTWLEVLQNANAAIKHYGNTEFGLGTMYDPLHAAAAILEDLLETGINPLHALYTATITAEDVVSKTKKGFRKQVDPGAYVVQIWLRAVYEGLQLRFE